MLNRRNFLALGVLAVCQAAPALATPRSLMLADIYHQGMPLDGYWVSEKYDGVRGYWDGKQFWTRNGEPIAAPAWFTAPLPNTPMDGELWAGRGRFELAVSAVRSQKPSNADWREMHFMVFDLPSQPGNFDARLAALRKLLPITAAPWVVPVAQERATTHADLEALLDKTIKLGGKYTGQLGALLVESPDGRRFKLGSGFSDAQREDPPSVGAWVSYRYNGVNPSGLPRFARFLRVREDLPRG